MSVWIKLDADYPTHPKTLRLCRLLGDVADAYPIRLWTWCARYAKDGKPDCALVEEACRWKGDTGALIAALKTVGFLDEDGSVHDWNDWTGEFLDQLECRRKRQRQAKKSRRRRSEEVGEKSARHLRDVADRSARNRRPEGEEKESREEEIREEEQEEHPGTPPPPAAADKLFPDPGPVTGKPTRRRGLGEHAQQVVAFLDRELRKRDDALALPEKLPEEQCIAANRLMQGQDVTRVKGAIRWAMEDAFWSDKISGVMPLAKHLRAILNGSAQIWKQLGGQVAFLDD